MGILEKIAEIEREIARTQKNKGRLTASTGEDNAASEFAVLAMALPGIGI